MLTKWREWYQRRRSYRRYLVETGRVTARFCLDSDLNAYAREMSQVTNRFAPALAPDSLEVR